LILHGLPGVSRPDTRMIQVTGCWTGSMPLDRRVGDVFLFCARAVGAGGLLPRRTGVPRSGRHQPLVAL
jgi:hypothetical protein